MIDHVAGSRRGQRQELSADEVVRFGRHPENEVSFDAHRDLDASARHAELRREGESFALVDVGSSNGILVDGERVSEVTLAAGEHVIAEFGRGGPKVRIFIAEGDAEPPEIAVERGSRRSAVLWVALVALVATVVAVIAAVASR